MRYLQEVGVSRGGPGVRSCLYYVMAACIYLLSSQNFMKLRSGSGCLPFQRVCLVLKFFVLISQSGRACGGLKFHPHEQDKFCMGQDIDSD